MPQAFIYNTFNHIEQTYTVKSYNGYEKYINRLKKRYMEFSEIIYNSYLNIIKYVL